MEIGQWLEHDVFLASDGSSHHHRPSAKVPTPQAYPSRSVSPAEGLPPEGPAFVRSFVMRQGTNGMECHVSKFKLEGPKQGTQARPQ